MGEVVKIRGYNVWISVKKGLKSAGIALASTAIYALLKAFDDPNVVGQILKDVPYSAALIPIIVGIIHGELNRRKNQ